MRCSCRGWLFSIWLALIINAEYLLLVAGSIVNENAKEGSTRWWVKQTNFTLGAEGFSTKFSYAPGDTVLFKINPNSSEPFRLEIYRMGYYGGKGGRLLASFNTTSEQQPKCYFKLPSRLTDCSNWRVSANWTIPTDSYTGVYVALPVHYNQSSNNVSYGSYIPFVVRQPAGQIKSDILFKTADLTWVAYNQYGRYNLYRGDGSAFPVSRAMKASYNRPWQNRILGPDGNDNNFLFGSEYAMLFWLEKQCYDVSYASCSDVEDMHIAGVLVPSSGSNSVTTTSPYQVMLSVGHDEYWTAALKAAYEAARDNGVNLAFFSGNEVYWRVLWDEETHVARHSLRPNVDGYKVHSVRQNTTGGKVYQNKSAIYDQQAQKVIVLDNRRIVVCRKETINNLPAATAEDWTGTFRDPRHRSPEDESLLSGQWFMVNGYREDAMQITRDDAMLRFWRNTSFAPSKDAVFPASAEKSAAAGQEVVYTTSPGVLGYEWDMFPINSRPMGLMPLSTTHIPLKEHLVQDFGAAYQGSGVATHRLSLYRHYHRAVHRTALGASETISELHQTVCNKINPLPAALTPTSALVFGAGTVQWSWVLSTWHDGEAMNEDRDLQQATLNVLADMNVFPRALTDLVPNKVNQTSKLPLVMPVKSKDIKPPKSAITHVEIVHKENQPAQHTLRVRGRAEDLGGGAVAAVEVSVDAGQTWHPASGRHHWHFTHHFGDVGPAVSKDLHADILSKYRNHWVQKNVLYAAGNNYHNTSLVVMSRAIDDSGWIQDVHYSVLQALCLLGSQKFSSDARSASTKQGSAFDMIKERKRLSPSVLMLELA